MQLVDWQVASATAVRLAPPGPRLSLEEAIATVEDLRALAGAAAAHVGDYTGLESADATVANVVDRPGWVRSNIEGFRSLVDPVLDSVLAGRRTNVGPVLSAVGSRATGVEVGVLLAYLSTRVLGQFELFGPLPDGAAASGRLTLVAPNIVATERAMGVDPHDFRLWVCLHEVTHRTQFGAAPWLRDHVQELMRSYLSAADLDPSALLGRLRAAAGSLADAARGRSEMSLLELVQTPEQREVLDRVTGLMSLLEGHADVVMDGVGPAVVPSVAAIRARFEQRRRSGGRVEHTLRRLLGVEMKMRQYAEGARFVRTVVDEVGMESFNLVWSGPGWLPSAQEIRQPGRWLDRIATDPPAVSA